MERPKDSLFPHVAAIATNPTVWKWARRGLLACVTYGIIPATQVVRERLQQLHDDHVAVGLATLRVTQLTKSEEDVARAIHDNQLAEREAVVLSTRALVEYIAGVRKMPVNDVLKDYDNLSKNWRIVSPKCLDEVLCPLPADAAQRALVARRPR